MFHFTGIPRDQPFSRKGNGFAEKVTETRTRGDEPEVDDGENDD